MWIDLVMVISAKCRSYLNTKCSLLQLDWDTRRFYLIIHRSNVVVQQLIAVNAAAVTTCSHCVHSVKIWHHPANPEIHNISPSLSLRVNKMQVTNKKWLLQKVFSRLTRDLSAVFIQQLTRCMKWHSVARVSRRQLGLLLVLWSLYRTASATSVLFTSTNVHRVSKKRQWCSTL